MNILGTATSRAARAAAKLVTRHAGAIWRIARGVLHSAGFASDLQQDVYLLLAERLEQGERLDHPAAWIRTAARTRALHLAQHRRVVAASESAAGRPSNAASAERDGPFEASCDAELGRAIRLATAALPVRQRAVFVMRCVEKLPNARIAVLLGIRPATVGRLLYRARLRLQGTLARHAFDFLARSDARNPS